MVCAIEHNLDRVSRRRTAVNLADLDERQLAIKGAIERERVQVQMNDNKTKEQ